MLTNKRQDSLRVGCTARSSQPQYVHSAVLGMALAIHAIAFTCTALDGSTSTNEMWVGGSCGSGSSSYAACLRSWEAKQQVDAGGPDRIAVEPYVLLPTQRWMTPELIRSTCSLWSNRYRRRVGPNEAIEILGNVRAFAEVMLNRPRTETST